MSPPVLPRALVLLLALTALPAATLAQAADEGAEVSLRPVQKRSLGDYPGHAGHEETHQDASFRFGPLPYGISYNACTDPAHAPNVAPLEGYVGMPQPSSCNWYHSGFLFVRLNGRDVGATPLSSMLVAETGRRALLDLVWHAPEADVRVRFAGLPGHDELFCEIAVDPKAPLEGLSVTQRCYPSYFTSWNHRAGARRIETPGTVVTEGQDATVPGAENWWALYSDDVFDAAQGEGEGPCGMLVLPEQAAEVQLHPGDYAVDTVISFRPECRRVRLAFWDFHGVTNAAARERLVAGAERVQQELRDMDLTPAAERGFDWDGLRDEVRQALAGEAAHTELGPRLQEAEAWLDAVGAGGQGQGPVEGVAAEEAFLQAASRYYGFMWEIRLAQLLDEIAGQEAR
jgi:hypothetical protein